MNVLAFIGGVLGLGLIWFLVEKFDGYVYRTYRYRFFDWSNYLLIGLCDGLLYFGIQWFLNAQSSGGDILNGILLIIFGVIGLGWIIYHNCKKSSWKIGLLGSLFQIGILSALAVVGAIIVLGLMALFSETKPTYCINNHN